MTETVSGREYTATRVRGFADWNPRPETLHLIGRVQGILTRYRAQLPLTIRQIFYVLVGSDEGYPKTEQAYARLAEALNRARRARLIRFDAIRDDGTQSSGFEGWDSPAQWTRAIRNSAENYRHNLTEGQEFHVELWVEAGGMVPQAAAVATDYGIITYSAGGFNGLTDKYETASRLAGEDRPSIVLHCGDYDPSGLSIIDALAQDVTALAAGLGSLDVEFRRIVVTPEQIETYGAAEGHRPPGRVDGLHGPGRGPAARCPGGRDPTGDRGGHRPGRAGGDARGGRHRARPDPADPRPARC
jgi:hypothetical protein